MKKMARLYLACPGVHLGPVSELLIRLSFCSLNWFRYPDLVNSGQITSRGCPCFMNLGCSDFPKYVKCTIYSPCIYIYIICPCHPFPILQIEQAPLTPPCRHVF
jgi:hypothetical protein